MVRIERGQVTVECEYVIFVDDSGVGDHIVHSAVERVRRGFAEQMDLVFPICHVTVDIVAASPNISLRLQVRVEC